MTLILCYSVIMVHDYHITQVQQQLQHERDRAREVEQRLIRETQRLIRDKDQVCDYTTMQQ